MVHDAYYLHLNTNQVLWGVKTRLNNLCNTDIPNIDFSVLLHNADTSVVVFRNIEDDPTHSLSAIIPAPLNGTLYHSNLDFNLIDKVTGAISIYSTVYITYPTKGSFTADSAYFFSNLNYMSCKITAHKPK